jgi:hypothetical protein
MIVFAYNFSYAGIRARSIQGWPWAKTPHPFQNITKVKRIWGATEVV